MKYVYISRNAGLAVAAIHVLLCPLVAHAQVTTAQYGNARTGATLTETTLSPGRIDVNHFGKLFSLSVDGDVYGQPLYVPGLDVPGQGRHDVIFVATEHDSVYAFDAEAKPLIPLWKVSFLNKGDGVTTVPPVDLSCPFIRPEVGISSTPVIDLKTETMYVLARTKEHKQYIQRLHALDIRTGAEELGGPATIAASVDGPAKDGVPTKIDFDPMRENQRASLLLDRNVIYLAWASSCDVAPYHGWVISYDAHTLKQKAAFNTTPAGKEGGIWQGDAGPAADGRGNVYVVTGNGTFSASSAGPDYGDSVLKLRWRDGALRVQDYFTPYNQEKLNADDLDLGSSGPVLLPGGTVHKHLLIVAGKGEGAYVLDRDQLGKYRPDSNANTVEVISGLADCFGAPAYWNQNVYYVCENDSVKQFRMKDGEISPEPIARSQAKFSGVGATPTVSANGTRNGIVWVVATPNFFYRDAPAVLHAYDASDVSHELWNSEQKSSRDRAGTAVRFSMPTVANGRVYIGVKKEVDVYGLLPGTTTSNDSK